MKTAFEYTNELLRNQVPSMAYDGGDPEVWKAKARAKLSDLLGMGKFQKVDPKLDIEYETQLEKAKEIRFTFQSEEGYRVPCHLLLPNGVENPPVMICLQGHSTGMHISLGRAKYEGDEESINGGDRDFCVRAVAEGFAAIALEQRTMGESRNEKSSGCANSTMTNLLMGRTTIGERVWDVSRLIDVLEESFADVVDTSCITLMGNSGGGTATGYTAALEDRLVLAMPSCAMCAFTESIGAMHHCVCNYVPRIAEYFDMGEIVGMAYPKYFVQVSGALDNGFLIKGSRKVYGDGKKIYDAAGLADRCVLVVGEEGHRFYADLAWPEVHRLLNR